MIRSLITAPKIHTDLLWGLAAFFSILAVVYLISVFVFRNKISKEARLVRAKKKELSPIISEFLFYDEKGDKIEKINYIGLKVEIRELIKNDFDRKVLTEIVMDLRKDVSGATRSELFHIYRDLELHKDAYKKLRSWRWELVSKGLFELTQMNVVESYELITRFINDKRGTIRKQAEVATVTLKEDGISYFLDNTKYKISEWQQLKLMDVVRNKENFIPPAFRLWLTSKNNYVVLFCLRLIKYYNQNDSHASLIELVKHKNNHIKREAIQCITAFHITEALPVLKMVFRKCNTDVKMTILEALGELGSEEDIDFLKQVEATDKDFTVRNKAVRAINTISPEVILPTQDITAESDWKKDETVTDNASEVIEKVSELSSEPPVLSQIEVVYETISEIEIEKPSMEVNPEDISFLPVVTEETKIISEHKAEEFIDPILEMSVTYEEVSSIQTLAKLNFDFLPIVKEKLDVLENQHDHLDVVFEVILPTPHAKNLENILVEFKILKIPSKTLLEDANPDKEFRTKTKTIDFRALNVIYSEVQIELAKDNLDAISIDWSTAFQPNQTSDFKEENTITALLDAAEIVQNEVKNEIAKEAIIPKPEFHKAETLETMVLLESIAELGDHREIPYLKLLLENETSIVVKERIEELINSFTNNNDGINYFKVTHSEPGYSVFHELFKKSDVESKLVLLHEVAAVGDEKEIPLLNSLLEDDAPIIRKNAAITLKLLNERLLEEVKNEISEFPIDALTGDETALGDGIISSENPKAPLLDLNFELEKSGALPISKDNRNTAEISGSTLFDHLCAVSTKFYNKLNG